MGPKIQNGLLFAAATIGIHILFYLIKPELNANIGLGFLLTLVIPIFFVRRGILQERDINEGNITFGEAFVTGGAIYFIGILLGTILVTVFINFLPEYKDMLNQLATEASLDFTARLMSWFGASPEDISKALEESQGREIDAFSPLMAGFSVFGSLFFPGAPIVLLTAAFIKKK